MSTAHHFIKEARAAHESREATMQSWYDLIRGWRAGRLIAATWVAVFAFFALAGALFVSGRPDLRLIYFPPVAFLTLTLPILFVAQKRREDALLSIIARESPELSRKLHVEGIRVREWNGNAVERTNEHGCH